MNISRSQDSDCHLFLKNQSAKPTASQAAKATAIKEDAEKDLNEALPGAQPGIICLTWIGGMNVPTVACRYMPIFCL